MFLRRCLVIRLIENFKGATISGEITYLLSLQAIAGTSQLHNQLLHVVLVVLDHLHALGVRNALVNLDLHSVQYLVIFSANPYINGGPLNLSKSCWRTLSPRFIESSGCWTPSPLESPLGSYCQTWFSHDLEANSKFYSPDSHSENNSFRTIVCTFTAKQWRFSGVCKSNKEFFPLQKRSFPHKTK